MKLRFFLTSLIILIFVYVSRNYILDDGLIYARYIEMALHHQGLVFNPGEPVNALTSPLFAYLLLLTSWILHGHVLLAEQILFTFFLLATCFLAEQFVPYSSLAIAVTAYFYFLIGMETTLFLFLITLTVKLYVDTKINWLPFVLALTLLTRFEGGLLIPIVGWHLWQEKKIPKASSFLPPLLLVFVYAALNYHWYRKFLPNSTISKLQQGLSGYWGWWPSAFLRAHVWALGKHGVFTRTFYVIPIVAVLAWFGWKELHNTRMAKIAVPFCLSLTAFYVLFNIPNYHWYYAPLIFFAIIFAVQAIPKHGWCLAAMATVLFAEGVTNLQLMRGEGPDRNYVQMSLWIRSHTPPQSRIASAEIGQIGWYSDRYLIDIIGLTNPKNSTHIANRDVTSWINEDKPDYVIVHKPEWVWEKGIVGSSDYEEMPSPHFGDIYLLQKKLDN